MTNTTKIIISASVDVCRQKPLERCLELDLSVLTLLFLAGCINAGDLLVVSLGNFDRRLYY
jgi:hypothetical protein